MNESEKKHPLGVTLGDKDTTCGSCVWAILAGPGPKVLRCVAENNSRIEREWASCMYFEPSLDCLSCAACCGPAFDVVEVSVKDPVRKLQPEWIAKTDGRFHVLRKATNHCAALQNDNKCVIYQDRPKCCRDFTKGSANCIFARRRVGLSQHWK